MSIQLATLDPRQVRLDQLKAETNTESLTSVPFSQPARAKVALDMRPARENPMDRHSSRHAPARAISNGDAGVDVDGPPTNAHRNPWRRAR